MIVKAALLLFRTRDDTKQLMFVRAFGRPHFVFPGGKQEAGETIEQALRRELEEELRTKAKDIHPLGIVEGNTPDGRPLQMHLYSAVLLNEPQPSSEIEKIVWMSQEEALTQSAAMTPMTLEYVFPFLKRRKLW
ncbi:NUDIX domain-containing protein [Candidatus Parcubacteria bacterium]|nr:NUDIX domain-containing protein [Candidatus Parcubacteria bacterium]